MAVIFVSKGDTTFKRRAGIVGWITLGVNALDPRRAFANIGKRSGMTFRGGQPLDPASYLVDLCRSGEYVFIGR